jgi:putative ABC transport system permease protein
MSGAGRALENGVMDGIKAFATNSAFFWTESLLANRTKDFSVVEDGTIKTADIEYIRQNVKEIEYLSPKLFGPNTNSGDNTIRGKKEPELLMYTGDYPDFFKIDQWTPIKGRLINEIDILHKRKVCIIGERIAEVMFEKDEDPIGKYLKVSGVYYQVVGVIHAENPH